MSENVISQELSDHSFRVEIPQIMWKVGYKSADISVYGAIKAAAGDNNRCFKSNKNLAKDAGVSIPTLIKSRNKLSEVNNIIGKAPLKVVHRVCEVGDKDTNEITITNIWPENGAFFKNQGGSKKTTLPSKKTTLGGVVKKRHEGSKKTTHKQDPFNKIPLNNNSEAESVAVFFDCIKNECIEDSEKEWICKFGEDRVKLAMAYVNDPNTKISTTRLRTIKWHVKAKIPPEAKQDKFSSQRVEALKFNCFLRKKGYEEIAKKNDSSISGNKMFILFNGRETSVSLMNSLDTLKDDFNLCAKEIKAC